MYFPIRIFDHIFIFGNIWFYSWTFKTHWHELFLQKKKCVLSFFYELYCNIYEIDFYLCDGMLQAWFEKWHDQLNTSIGNMTDDQLYTQYMYWKYC